MNYIKINSEKVLENILERNNIHWRLWGKKESTRPIKKLWAMIRKGEVIVYKNRDNQIVLMVKSVAVDVYFPVTRKVVDKLIETGYHLRNGVTRKRGYKYTLGGNIRPCESPLRATKRAVRTELGKNFKVRLMKIGDRPDPIVHSEWFPELMVDRHRFEYIAVLENKFIHSPNPYKRRKRSNGTPARYVTYEWFPKDVRRLPFSVQKFVTKKL